MVYSEFTLSKVKQQFNLTTFEKIDIFASIPELEESQWLKETLQYYLPLVRGSNSEKARSELIITPVLVELKKQFSEEISLFSGIDFTVDETKGLNGICDFIISNSPEMLIINAPVITIVEAKKENINAGLGQCIAEMVAAQIFNKQSGSDIKDIYGVVTTGTNWQFLKLEGQVIKIDLTEYFISDVRKILGILASSIHPRNNNIK